jgi:DNA-directed RNA polymerase specialized sigma24 family protein
VYIALAGLTRLSRSLFRSATLSRYRAGVATGLLATLLIAFGPSGARSGAETADSPVLGRWASVAASAAAQGSVVEAERRILVEADHFIDPAVPVVTAAAAPVELSAGPLDEAAFSLCLQQITQANEEPIARAMLEHRYRLSPDDAFDLVRDTVIDVCLAHARAPLASPGAVLHRSVRNNANTDWKRRKRVRCGISDELPSCTPAPDENVRFAGEQARIEKALCAEDDVHRAAIYLRLHDGLEFAAIGGALKISEADARSKFNNALRRVQKRVRDACGG